MYENPNRIKYSMSQLTLTSTDKVMVIVGPKGKTGKIWDVGFEYVSTTFAGATNTPKLAVGTVADPDAYFDDWDVGALVAPTAKTYRSTYRPTDAAWATNMLNGGELPADTPVQLTAVAATGGGAAGVANAFVIIDWAD